VAGGKGNFVTTVVNRDSSYEARTTRRALSLLFERFGHSFGRLQLEQYVDVPIGAGFGASAASAISAVYAAASALEVGASESELARCAHDSEIIEQTGLGTVSVTYTATGAGAITKPGIPGVARFLNVKVPCSMRLVTASIAPCDNREMFSHPETTRKIITLGDEALRRFLRDPTLEELAAAGEWFSDHLGLSNNKVKKLIKVAKSAGASHASQNMIGQAIHALVDEDGVGRVADALRSTYAKPRVDVFEVGLVKATLL
jgi:pantoate kinase